MTLAFRIGSLAQDVDTNLKSGKVLVSAGNYDCFEIPVGTNYQVPADTEFIITKLQYHSTVANNQFELGYGDTAVDNGAGAPTNYLAITGRIVGLLAYELYSLDMLARVPTAKYPHIRTLGSTTYANVYGYERSTA